MSTLTITRGLPGSGKTTFARAWVDEAPHRRARVNRDDLRAMLYGRTDRLTYEQEAEVTKASRQLAATLLAAGRDVIADDMNLRPRYVREWRRFAAANGHDFEWIELPVDVELSVKRDAERDRTVGEDVIRGLARRFTRDGGYLPIPDEQPAEAPPPPIEYDPNLPDAVIVDIDGTVALMGDRDPYDLTRVHEDAPNVNVVALVEELRWKHQIIFLSGREDSSRAVTETWLENNVDRAEDEPVYMRAADDKRRDSIVKRELFDAHVRGRYNVRLVLDDRQQVVDMWRDLGLTCLQVAPGDF